jgi:hypothetical protein
LVIGIPGRGWPSKAIDAGSSPAATFKISRTVSAVRSDVQIIGLSCVDIKRKGHKMLCPQCSGQTRRFGKDKLCNQRYRCDACPKTFIAEKKEIRLDQKTVKLCIKLDDKLTF